jgi:hypothetical protein
MSAQVSSRRFLIVAAALVASAALVLFGRALFLGELFVERDLAAFYYPAKWLLAPLAKAVGGIPLWNPFFASGQPFAGNPEHELFHPMTALFFLLPFDWAFRLQVILPPLLAIPSMYWFLRVLRRSRSAALAGGLAWGLGGYMLSATCLLPELFTAFALPLTLAFGVLVSRRAKVGRVVGLAFCLALQCLAGEPGTLLPLLPLLAAALLAGSSQRLRSNKLSVGLGLGLGLGLGVAIAAAAILPALHHAGRTIRAAGLTEAMANEWSMPAVRMFELFSPNVLGHVDRTHLSRYWGRGYYGAKTFAFYYSLYPGLLVSLLALPAWFARRRAMWLWAAAALLGFLIALGDGFPLWPLLRHLPGLSGIRYPEKASVLFLFPVLVVGSHGFDWFLLGRPRAHARVLWMLGCLATVGLLVAGGLWFWSTRSAPSFSVGDAIGGGLRLCAVASVSGAALRWSRSWHRQRRGLLLCGLLCVDLVAAGRELLPTVPNEVLATPPVFLRPLLRPDRDDLVFHMAEWDSKHSDMGGLAKPPIPARWGIPTTLERDFDFTQLKWTFESTRAWMVTANQDQRLIEPLLQRRGVTAIVRFAPGVHWQGGVLVRPGGGPSVELLFAAKSNGFAFAAKRVEIVDGVAGWQAKVSALGDEVVDTACVERDELPAFSNPPGPASVRVRRNSPEDFTLEVDAAGPSPSFVAVNQTWDPGWRVSLDGAPTRLLRTDLALSGVIVPPGAHRLSFEYHDAWVSVGILVSLLASLGALLALLWARRYPSELSSLRSEIRRPTSHDPRARPE